MILRLLLILLLIFIVYRIIRFMTLVNKTARNLNEEIKNKQHPGGRSNQSGSSRKDVIELSQDDYEVK